MNTNKIVIYVTIISLLLLISIPTVYKVIKKNYNSLNLVTEKYIIETAERCFYEGVCKESTVTLKELYSYHYIKEDVVDPISKVVYSDKSYITIYEDKSIFTPLY